LPYLAEVIGVQSDWRMVAFTANGQPAAAAYRCDDDGVLRAFGIAVLDVTATRDRPHRRVRRSGPGHTVRSAAHR